MEKERAIALAKTNSPRRLLHRAWLGQLLVGLVLTSALGACARRPGATGLGAYIGFPVGTCVGVEKLQTNLTYRTTIAREFSGVTAETAMKMDALQPRQNEFSWTQADALVKSARQQRQRVHGHTLVWHVALPTWVKEFKGDSAAWEQLLKQHIQATVLHFGRRIKAWDVVNEAYQDDGTYTNSIWYQHLGPGYVARSFRYARQAAPRALLFYNDWDLEVSASKLDHTLKLLADLKAQGIRVDGIGFQMHTSIDVPVATIAAALRKVAALGYQVHISELDVEVNRQGTATGSQPAVELLARQQQLIHDIVLAYRQLPAAQQYGITLWGASDADSWLPAYKGHPEWPLLLDATYHPKPAYQGFEQALAAPLTRK